MLVPMILPLVYSMKNKRDALVDIGSITIVMMLIVIVYWPPHEQFFLPIPIE
jgi:hypothetical protein